MDILEKINLSGLVPVVVIEETASAVPTAKALLGGGVDVMEITMRTDAALDAIRQVAQQCPDMLVGAGTVLTAEHAKACVEAGAKFIVSPGFSRPLAAWCVENNVAVVPGCATPGEIMSAMELGLRVVKFFPADVYGGLSAMKSLSGPFGKLQFIPTGGINAANLADYAAAPFICAVGGSWLCAKGDIAVGAFDKITSLAQEAVWKLHGFELRHVGINCENNTQAEDVSARFGNLFGFAARPGNSSIFVGDGIEVMRERYLGTFGHLALAVNSIPRAVAWLASRGMDVDWETAKYKDGRCQTVYLEKEIGGFGVHLLQR